MAHSGKGSQSGRSNHRKAVTAALHHNIHGTASGGHQQLSGTVNFPNLLHFSSRMDEPLLRDKPNQERERSVGGMLESFVVGLRANLIGMDIDLLTKLRYILMMPIKSGNLFPREKYSVQICGRKSDVCT